MSTPYFPEESGTPTALGILMQAFTGQESESLLGQLIERFGRWLMGDPVAPVQAQSTGTANVATLNDYPGVKSALIYVDTNSIFARFDGTAPVAGADFYIPQGSYIILTGIPSIKGMQFVSAVAGNANLRGAFFT